MTNWTPEYEAETERICEAATPAPWSTPHFCDDECKCDCGYVLTEQMMGAVCEVFFEKKKPSEEGFQDHPEKKVAIANGRFIAHSRTALPRAIAEIRRLRPFAQLWSDFQACIDRVAPHADKGGHERTCEALLDVVKENKRLRADRDAYAERLAYECIRIVDREKVEDRGNTLHEEIITAAKAKLEAADGQ